MIFLYGSTDLQCILVLFVYICAYLMWVFVSVYDNGKRLDLFKFMCIRVSGL